MFLLKPDFLFWKQIENMLKNKSKFFVSMLRENRYLKMKNKDVLFVILGFILAALTIYLGVLK